MGVFSFRVGLVVVSTKTPKVRLLAGGLKTTNLFGIIEIVFQSRFNMDHQNDDGWLQKRWLCWSCTAREDSPFETSRCYFPPRSRFFPCNQSCTPVAPLLLTLLEDPFG